MTATNPGTLVDLYAARGESRASALAIKLVAALFFAALTGAAAQVSGPVPFTEVPFTLQPMVVLIAGLTLGARLGCASQVLYLAAGIAGLPVFAASVSLPPGALRLLGPTGGYLLSYPVAAFVAGALAERGFDRKYATSVLAMIAGLIVVYAFGTAWLGFFARTAAGSAAVGLSAALATGVYPFVIADLVKVAIAAGIVPSVWSIVAGQRPRAQRR